MDQSKKHPNKTDQFFYINRWVDKKNFRAYVYNKEGHAKLANSYEEFENLTSSGIWFEEKPEVSPKIRKLRNVTLSNSE